MALAPEKKVLLKLRQILSHKTFLFSQNKSFKRCSLAFVFRKNKSTQIRFERDPMKNLFGFLAFLGFGLIAPSQQIDSATDEAVAETQALMKNSSQRTQILNQDQQAKKSDDFAKQVAGTPENTEIMYGVAADLLPWIMKEANGDPAVATALMQEALKDPKKFLERLPATERSKIKDLAEKVPNKGKSKP